MVTEGPFNIIDIVASGGPTQVYRHQYSPLAVGPFDNIDNVTSVGPFRIIGDIIKWSLRAHSIISTLLLRWAYSGLSTLLFGDGCGPIQKYRHLCFGGPIQDYRHQYSPMAVGPFKNIDIVASVGPLRFIDTIIRRWLWAHLRISTPLLRWAHSGLSAISLSGH